MYKSEKLRTMAHDEHNLEPRVVLMWFELSGNYFHVVNTKTDSNYRA